MHARPAGIMIAASLLAAIASSAPPICSAAAQRPPALQLEVLTPQAGQYERIDFRLQTDRQYRNPFDPDEVDMALRIRGPQGAEVMVPAFFAQDYRRQQVPGDLRRDWCYPVGLPGWKARFATGLVGRYTATAVRRDAAGTTESAPVAFEVLPKPARGFVRVSRQDPRFLAFDDGSPYFAIGHNHAFVGSMQYANLARSEKIFAQIAQNGGNFLRIWVCCEDWATAIEARKSAWGRSWAWRPPIVPMPDNPPDAPGHKCIELAPERGGPLAISPSHPLAVLPETAYVLSGRIRTEPDTSVHVLLGGRPLGESIQSPPQGWVAFSRRVTTGASQFWLDTIALQRQGKGKAWLDGLSLVEARAGPELLWEADVNRPVRGYYNPLDCFIVDQLVEAAENTGLYLQLTLITRDLYMGTLKDPKSARYAQAIADAKKLLRYAVARWGYSTHVAAWEYFNEIDPGLPTEHFYEEVGRYLERIDPYGHLRTTSTWHPSPSDWKHPQLDVAQAHHYLRPDLKEAFRDEVAGARKAIDFLLAHTRGKPALMAEFGLAENNFQLSAYMKRDRELVHFHNALWASALSGTAGTVAFWWWEQLDQMGAYRHYRPLADFVADIPWTTGGLHAIPASATRGLRVVGLSGKDQAYFWVQNPEATWWNLVVEGRRPEPIRDATVEIRSLADGNYRAEWWDTYSGKPVAKTPVQSQEGTVRLTVPAIARDTACKVVMAADNKGKNDR